MTGIRSSATGDNPARRWPIIVVTLRKLKAENKLTAEQAKCLPIVEQRMAGQNKQ